MVQLSVRGIPELLQFFAPYREHINKLEQRLPQSEPGRQRARQRLEFVTKLNPGFKVRTRFSTTGSITL